VDDFFLDRPNDRFEAESSPARPGELKNIFAWILPEKNDDLAARVIGCKIFLTNAARFSNGRQQSIHHRAFEDAAGEP
jgi:hypothetical protein